MATYKKGFKKQTSEQMLLQVIVGIIIAVVIFVFAAFIYDLATRVPNYDDYAKVVKYEEVFSQTDEEENPIANYSVYFFQEGCTGCAEIADDVLKLANRITKKGGTFMVADVDDITDAETKLDEFLETIQLTPPMSVPLLVTVVDGELAGVYVGTTAVVDTLESIKDDAYEPFN